MRGRKGRTTKNVYKQAIQKGRACKHNENYICDIMVVCFRQGLGNAVGDAVGHVVTL